MSKPIRHGTMTGYTTDLCRCEECRAAIREYQRKRRKNRAKQPPKRSELKHGTAGRYRKGCRCEECCEAFLEYGRDYRRRRDFDAAGLPIDTQKFQGQLEEALQAFSADPGYLVLMLHAAASVSVSPQEQ
ncbi:hypothetical protein [Micromonospora chersina]|uniref:hypothetical protein n=1 Tax=Micromonospora chersina TaxID=47854 RepID=UPI00371D3142